MTSKRRTRQENEEWTKENDSIAQLVRFNCPTETTLFHGNEVHYFSGSKAVDTLFNSKYGPKNQGESSARFYSRRSAEDFMQLMLERKMIWRAKKLVPKKKEKNEEGKDATKSPKMKDPKGRNDKIEEIKKSKEEDDEVEETDAEKKEEDKTEKKKKVKLVEHSLQHFNDSNDCYVWIYDPTPLYKKVIGILMILGAIGCCCFPLWPPIVRQGVYYLSMTGIGFFGVIIGVAVARTILFGVIWLVTGGEHKLWILPNLTEDVGFFESFQPWYSYQRASDLERKKKEKDDKKKGKKDKNSDDEVEDGKKQETEEQEKESEEFKEGTQSSASASVNSEEDSKGSDEDEEDKKSAPPSPSADQPRKRRPRKDDGDFVIVNK